MSKTQAQKVLDALDALAIVLTNQGHIWSDKERSLYEVATSLLSTIIRLLVRRLQG